MSDKTIDTADIRVESGDGINILRFNRPEKKNAITAEMYEKLTAALSAGDRSGNITAHLLIGTGGVFTAGNDLNEFLAFSKNGALGEPIVAFLKRIATIEKPLIAGVDGLAIGLGTTMLFHCDLVYASEQAVFQTPFLNLGLVPEAASSLLLPRRMGYVRAFEMLCLGEAFDAQKALLAGFVNAVVPAEQLEETALNAARKLAAKPPDALRAARRLLRGKEGKILKCIDREVEIFAERLCSSEAREAFSAFLEKRPPDFTSKTPR